MMVIGASRGTGLASVRKALAEGHHVRALARHADAIPIEDEKLEKVPGDARNQATIQAALTGVDTVLLTLGVSFGPRALFEGTRLFSEATRSVIDAMKRTGTRRLIVVTGLGAGDSRGHGGLLYDAVLFPLLLKRVYDDKDVQEQMVRQSGLDWTIVRPTLLNNGPATGSYRVLDDPKDWRGGSISRADVADFLVRQVSDRTHIGKTPLLIG